MRACSCRGHPQARVDDGVEHVDDAHHDEVGRAVRLSVHHQLRRRGHHDVTDVGIRHGDALGRGIEHQDSRPTYTEREQPIAELGEPLWNAGLSLRNQGDIDAQAISGAIGTATHGSGIKYQALSLAMKGCRIVTGNGDVVVVNESTPDLLRAAQVSIGMLGVMTEVELSAAPAYRLRERIERWSWEETLAGWEENVRAHRHFSFFWLPFDESAPLYGIPVPEGTTGAGTCYVKIYDEAGDNEPDDDTPDNRVDRAYRIYPMPDFEPNFYEFEYYVPYSRSLEALAEMREFMLKSYPASLFPLEVRTTAADDAYLSPFYKSDMTVFSISGIPGTDYEPYLRAAHDLLGRYSARVHWGKVNFLTRDELDMRFPEVEAFRRIRRELDPTGAFLNESLRPLFRRHDACGRRVSAA